MPAQPPSTRELFTLGPPITLRDGSRLRIRQWRRSDTDLLVRAFERLGPESRYRRFLTPVPELSGQMLRYLTEIDHHDHEAIVAVDAQTGEGVGLTRYVRHRGRPEMAEPAVTVTDDWQQKGVGTLLLEVLGARGREEGITRFTALMLPTNRTMMDLREQLGPVRIVDREASAVEVEVPNPAVTVSPALRKLVRVAAEHDVAAPLSHRASARGPTGDPARPE
jgi:GNAT superfamily N-acetyltransferase